MDFKKVLVMGTFRTGSTFLAKALSAHKNMTVPSDPYFYFFKALRNEIFKLEGVKDFDCESPVADNFYSEYVEINQKIRKYDLNIPIKFNNVKQVVANIAKLAKRDNQKLVSYIEEITEANTYKDLFEQLVTAVNKAYGSEDAVYAGFKVTFTEQFLSVLINTYPDLKCVYLMRDPRAILASQNVFYQKDDHKEEFKNRGMYPLLYVIRHWRKSVAYLLENIEKKDNVYLVHYEKLMNSPEKYFKEICSFVGVDFDPNMCDASSYTDGSGKQWEQNSSYGRSTSITT